MSEIRNEKGDITTDHIEIKKRLQGNTINSCVPTNYIT